MQPTDLISHVQRLDSSLCACELSVLLEQFSDPPANLDSQRCQRAGIEGLVTTHLYVVRVS